VSGERGVHTVEIWASGLPKELDYVANTVEPVYLGIQGTGNLFPLREKGGGIR
jgi:hypothetical protein